MLNKPQILEAFHARHATKEFDSSKKISEEDFAFILETGRLSPSSFGFEPWKFLIVQNAELREKLQSFSWGAKNQLSTASHFVILLSRTKSQMESSSEHIQYMMKDVHLLPPEVIQNLTHWYDEFLKTGFALLDNERAMFEWASRQTYIALGNMMTSAALIGIDSCPIEGFDKKQAEDLLRSEGYLNDDEFGVSCMLAFGYRIHQSSAKKRRPIEQVAEWIN
ncbi:NAD(P)H-dependent oxidoreductase [Paenibacillus sp. GSMTC-2017]|uniref:NAD(P)H-dependent oxidoreductase n=1 Tax=Paenibacillus sp. GSMTC-2017 TaxID=2794350 RepID=UPI0018D776C8|nr:NAD(P)H-dependent oxidoreductase [Paenibacillus sp. GSMTC-2017]MBH5317108.1 NAD(P)H-dependent oxidoreductase [Paenibacillus sp. GSMTC-2017]